jgi:hypothetical protein
VRRSRLSVLAMAHRHVARRHCKVKLVNPAGALLGRSIQKSGRHQEEEKVPTDRQQPQLGASRALEDFCNCKKGNELCARHATTKITAAAVAAEDGLQISLDSTKCPPNLCYDDCRTSQSRSISNVGGDRLRTTSDHREK